MSALCRIPSAVGYQPTLATDMGLLQERITSTDVDSITSVQAVYTPPALMVSISYCFHDMFNCFS